LSHSKGLSVEIGKNMQQTVLRQARQFVHFLSIVPRNRLLKFCPIWPCHLFTNFEIERYGILNEAALAFEHLQRHSHHFT
ncbi:hypothetical protein PFISCL1PPCAC_18221, partial [Pristionchus fissidentatus]